MKRLPTASDPEEQRLREAWHEAHRVWQEEGSPSMSQNRRAFLRADERLCSYLWNRTLAEVEEDRRKHPKAKRNLPVGHESRPGNRFLP